ncbi:MAG TPA: 3-dehydroquinate synthase [Bacillota bacterium]|nr:3-dehydroquinate synthase [Bacillota bacterium]
METVRVDLGMRSYDIKIGANILPMLGMHLDRLETGRKILLVTNPTVRRLFCSRIIPGLKEKKYEMIIGEIGDGEEHKILSTAEKLYDLAFENGLDRRCPVVALGGGVIGDVAGFVAATFLRGVPFIQVPTTLLAQVDSSVGGKVAVNHPGGKNIIGSFYQPRLVLTDIETLSTLPEREIKSGLAEIIKYGVIWSRQFFEWLEDNIGKLLERDSGALITAVYESCRIKAKVVETDETERGLRAVLNFGHTFGHAVEVLTGYGTCTHGEAVGLGMAVAARFAEGVGLLGAPECERIVKIIGRAGLPVKLPENLQPEDLLKCFYRDKKSKEGRLTFILPRRIGMVIEMNVEEEGLLKFLKSSKA